MPRSALAGSRIRARRIDLGLRQAGLAEACGISASYLNLIEHNRRRVSGKLLIDIARILETDPTSLSQGADDAFLEELRSAAEGSRAEVDRSEEFAGRFPGWADLVRTQARRVERHAHTIETLSDRLAHDPFLTTSLHDILSAVTAIRSTSAILVEDETLEPAWQARFHRNVYEDSKRVAEASRALAGYLDAGADVSKSLASPQEEVDAWLERLGHRVLELEEAAAGIDEILGASPELASQAARLIARSYLEQYAADVKAMPADAVRNAAEVTGADPGAMAGRLGVGFAAAFRRIAVLGLGSDPLGLAICDASGAMLYRKPIDGFAIPRFGAACPLWPLFSALARPMVPLRETVETAGQVAQRFTTFAIAETRYPAGLDGPPVTQATMLVVPESAVENEQVRSLKIGTSCRICSRRACPARREPSVLAEPADRGTEPF